MIKKCYWTNPALIFLPITFLLCVVCYLLISAVADEILIHEISQSCFNCYRLCEKQNDGQNRSTICTSLITFTQSAETKRSTTSHFFRKGNDPALTLLPYAYGMKIDSKGEKCYENSMELEDPKWSKIPNCDLDSIEIVIFDETNIKLQFFTKKLIVNDLNYSKSKEFPKINEINDEKNEKCVYELQLCDRGKLTITNTFKLDADAKKIKDDLLSLVYISDNKSLSSSKNDVKFVLEHTPICSIINNKDEGGNVLLPVYSKIFSIIIFAHVAIINRILIGFISYKLKRKNHCKKPVANGKINQKDDQKKEENENTNANLLESQNSISQISYKEISFDPSIDRNKVNEQYYPENALMPMEMAIFDTDDEFNIYELAKETGSSESKILSNNIYDIDNEIISF